MPLTFYTFRFSDYVIKTEHEEEAVQGLETHSGEEERDYICDVCNKTFGFKSALSMHRKSHFLLTKPFECKICNKKFRSSRSLSAHKLVHARKPVQCK